MEGKIQLKIKNFSQYSEIKNPVDLFSEASYINNLPFKIKVKLNPNKVSKKIAIYLYSSEFDTVTVAE
jgi:hypothetical protein